jgi:hypothetical protein
VRLLDRRRLLRRTERPALRERLALRKTYTPKRFGGEGVTTVVISNRGRAETDALTRALVNLAARGLRTHCSDPGTSGSGYPTTLPNDAQSHASAPASPSSLDAEQQQTPAERSITFGAAATTHADQERQQHDRKHPTLTGRVASTADGHPQLLTQQQTQQPTPPAYPTRAMGADERFGRIALWPYSPGCCSTSRMMLRASGVVRRTRDYGFNG